VFDDLIDIVFAESYRAALEYFLKHSLGDYPIHRTCGYGQRLRCHLLSRWSKFWSVGITRRPEISTFRGVMRRQWGRNS